MSIKTKKDRIRKRIKIYKQKIKDAKRQQASAQNSINFAMENIRKLEDELNEI